VGSCHAAWRQRPSTGETPRNKKAQLAVKGEKATLLRSGQGSGTCTGCPQGAYQTGEPSLHLLKFREQVLELPRWDAANK
jgi:hypothetical protein